MPTARPIVFVSDFGLGNEWVGICHSVLAGISPRSPIVDLTHLIRPFEVQSGALMLADSQPPEEPKRRSRSPRPTSFVPRGRSRFARPTRSARRRRTSRQEWHSTSSALRSTRGG
jgi:hypothetical protein